MSSPSTTVSSSRAGDLWGGFASMLAAFPGAIAYGVMVYGVLGNDAGGVIFGVLGAVALGLIAPTVGGAPRLISTPCGPSALLLSAFACAACVASGSPTPASSP